MSKYGDSLITRSGLPGATLLHGVNQGISSGLNRLSDSIQKVNTAKITGFVPTEGSYDANVAKIKEILETVENKSLDSFNLKDLQLNSTDLQLVDELEHTYIPIVQARLKYLMEKSKNAPIASRAEDLRGLSAVKEVNPINQVKVTYANSLMNRIDSLILKVKEKYGEKYYSPNPTGKIHVEAGRKLDQLTARPYGGRKRKSRRRRAKITKRKKSRSKQKSKRRFR